MPVVDVSDNTMSSVPEPEDPLLIHERLVAYVHALNGDPEPRNGVWMEHSYARSRGVHLNGILKPDGSTAFNTRALLTRRPRYRIASPPPDAVVDVETPDVNCLLPPDPPYEPFGDDEDEEMEEEGWEQKMIDLAPSVVCREAATKAIDLLKSLRLSRLCGAGGTRDETRSHARLLRKYLAPLWLGPLSQRPAAWLHATLVAHLPSHYKELYEDMLAELRRSVPKLCERLNAQRLPAPAEEPFVKPGPAVMPMSTRPLLVWIGCGREKADARWERRLRALIPTHYIRLHIGEARHPEAWCASVVARARAALASLDAGPESCGLLALGGCGAGASLALQLACDDKRVQALVLLAPPLLTAEGIRDTPDDPLSELKIPRLLVIPECAQTVWWSAACEATRGKPNARLLLVGGADDALRLPHARRRSLRLPQHALDAAITEECARWLMEVVEGADLDTGKPDYSPPPKKIRHNRGLELVNEDDDDDDEYSHLPKAMPKQLANNNRAIAIVEGLVVSRVCGAKPVALVPRRPPTAPPASSPPIASTDIMSMPIVFADDEPAPNMENHQPLGNSNTNLVKHENHKNNNAIIIGKAQLHTQISVKSGNGGKHLKYTKVIVAKRASNINRSGPIVVRGAAGFLSRAAANSGR